MPNNQLIEIPIVVIGSLVLGWLVKKLVFPILYKLTRKTKWQTDDLIIENISKWVIFWFFIAACFYVLPTLTDYISQSFAFRGRKIQITEKDIIILKRILGSLYIFSITSVIANIVAGLLQIRSKTDGSVIVHTTILENIAKSLIYCIGFILILKNFGVEIAPLIAALGVGGLAVALALQPTLSNLFSGLQIIASGKVNTGDFIQLDNGRKGFVRDITWRNTTITTPQNNVIVVPNSKMADSIIENFILEDKNIVFHVDLNVGYESDLTQVEKISIEVAKEVLERTEGSIKDFSPFVRYTLFGENGISLRVYLKVAEFNHQIAVTSEFIKALHERYKKEGIDIPYPTRTIHMSQK